MSAPRKSTCTGTFYWSNGDLFDGYLLIGVVPPQSGGAVWPTVMPSDITSPLPLPPFYMIRLKLGIPETQTKVLYTSDITPPNTEYVAWLCDINLQLMTPTPSTTFTVTESTFTPPEIVAVTTFPSGDYPEPN